MDWLLSPEGGLWSLAAAAFLAATVLPLSSEAVLFGYLSLHPDQGWPAIVLATLANTAGGMTTYALGRYLQQRLQRQPPHQAPAQPSERNQPRQLERVRYWGAPVLALAWLPFIGEALVLAAGWLRVKWWQALLWQGLGRLVRYWVVALGALA
jgi:membrane protein YqaA with SNARE-associated domain